MTAPVLSDRVLDRTLLARQGLLERTTAAPADVVDGLVGLQAQVPTNPYLALWSRLDGFRPPALEARLLDRTLVRLVLQRGTIHLVTAADALGLRTLFQPVLDQELARHRDHAPLLVGVDLAPVLAAGRDLLTEPRTLPQLKTALAARFPTLHPAALAFACRNRLALVQVPPRGLWSRSGQVAYATAEAWLGQPVDPMPSLPALLLRYLRAFGPAATADMATWSRLTGLRDVVEGLAGSLRSYRDERGRTLLDVPDGHLATGDEPAPVRFLPEYDNVLLSHADRSRIIAPDAGALFPGDGMGRGSVLVEGLLQASWRLERPTATAPATLAVRHRPGLRAAALRAVTAEGRRTLAFLTDGLDGGSVVLSPAD